MEEDQEDEKEQREDEGGEKEGQYAIHEIRNIDIISGQRINLFNKNNNLTPVLKLTPFLS